MERKRVAIESLNVLQVSPEQWKLEMLQSSPRKDPIRGYRVGGVDKKI